MIEDVLALIPHRPPFLFVDRVIAIEEDNIITEKFVKPDEPFFQGHFPGNPIMPGVLVCEAIFQSGAILLLRIIKNSPVSGTDSEGVPVLTRIKDVKFKNPVRPGDQLQMRVELVEKIGGAYFMKGVARVNERTVVRVDFAVTLKTAH